MIILQKTEKLPFQSIRFDLKTVAEATMVEEQLKRCLDDSKGTVREMCLHIMTAGGKRVRPLLVLFSGLVFSREKEEELLRAAAAAELIHMASLVHDDIIDNSDLRRNKLSVNKVWGSHFAVLCGDYLFAKAFEILSGPRLARSLEYMVAAIEDMCHGEIIQADNRFNVDTALDTYYEIIGKKTAVLLKNCCKAGACISGASEYMEDALGEFGLHLGYAFQIIDDMLDLCGDSSAMGKPRGEDLRQGSLTMPIILLSNHRKYSARLHEIILERDFTEETIHEIITYLMESGVVEETFKRAVLHIEKAREVLAMLPESYYREFLFNLTDMLKTRMN